MIWLTNIAASFIFAGAVVMIVCIWNIRQILALLKQRKETYNWNILLFFTIIFLIGYAAAFLLIFYRNMDLIVPVTGLVFLMGAFFVFLVTRSSIVTIRELLNTMVEKSLLEKEIVKRKKAEEALVKKNHEILEYTHAVTHDLKKPLTTIKTINFLGQKGALDSGTEQGREAFTMQRDAIGYMQEMLEDLLMCAKLESGRHELDKQNVRIRDVVDEVMSHFRLDIEKKGIEVTIDIKEEVYADRKGLKKVFMNLIGNAVNYIGQPISPRISLSTYQQEKRCCCKISDNGIGIPDEAQKKIFEKFQRGGNVTGTSGSGLGLTIARSIVTMHGGEIWLKSNPEEGTSFFFTIPPGDPKI